MALTYTWKVTEVDSSKRILIVEYKLDGSEEALALNIGIPSAETTLENHVKQYAPIAKWKSSVTTQQLLDVTVGSSGTVSLEEPRTIVTESSSDATIWTEAELIALIKKTMAG